MKAKFYSISTRSENSALGGFTLIEISMGLIIVGLLISGILFGAALIDAARLRGQISQFEKFDAAISTFRIKYNAKPGDMSSRNAAAMGFRPRAGTDGEGDGDTMIEPCPASQALPGCEFVLFWADLSTAKLIKGTFEALVGDDEPLSTSTFDESLQYFPVAEIDSNMTVSLIRQRSMPYYEISRHESIGPVIETFTYNLDPTVLYQIDLKIDDGLPYTGKTLAGYYIPLTDIVYLPPIVPSPDRCATFGPSGPIYNVDRPDLRCPFYSKISTW